MFQANAITGSPHICLEYNKDQISRHFEFLIPARGLLVRGLEPRLRKSLVACGDLIKW